MNKLLKPLAFALALAAPAVGASTLTYQANWAGATVSMNYPDKVIYQTPFSWSFTVDSSTMDFYDQIAFLAEVGISNTVDLSGATWSYQSSSLDTSWNIFASGTLGDSFTALTATATGHQINFADPHQGFGAYSWLAASYEDKITWTLDNIIIQGDTAFSLRLDDQDILGGAIPHNIVVIDPPAPGAVAPVPLPPTYVLMLAGLGLLVMLGRRRQAAPTFCS